TAKRWMAELLYLSEGEGTAPVGLDCQPLAVDSSSDFIVISTGLRLVKNARTSNFCPGTGALMVGGAANSANGPVASGTPAGCAMALKSTPRAAVIAAWN